MIGYGTMTNERAEIRVHKFKLYTSCPDTHDNVVTWRTQKRTK